MLNEIRSNSLKKHLFGHEIRDAGSVSESNREVATVGATKGGGCGMRVRRRLTTDRIGSLPSSEGLRSLDRSFTQDLFPSSFTPIAVAHTILIGDVDECLISAPAEPCFECRKRFLKGLRLRPAENLFTPILTGIPTYNRKNS